MIVWRIPDRCLNGIRVIGARLEQAYRAFHGFGQAKFANDGLILGRANLHYSPSCLKLKKRQNRLKNNHLALSL